MPSLRYVLGLDIGVASAGWAIAEIDAADRPVRLAASGVVLFEPGTDPGKGGMQSIMEGRDTPMNAARRQARSMRRQTWRRAKRKRAVLRALIRHGLLPLPEGGAALRRPADIDTYVKGLDAALLPKWATDHRARQNWLYALRATAAAGGPLEPLEIGRALYHLAQRRGFLSNRRTDAKPGAKDEETGIKADIATLQGMIDAKPAEPRTLGALLATLDPDQTRLRGRWTARSMYLREFETIWQAQKAGHPGILTEPARECVHTAMFFQRPLKDQSHLIGRCSLLPSERRCPVALREYQEFRTLQSVNALEVAESDRPPRRLTAEERASVIASLMRDGDLTFARARTLLRLPRTSKFNLEAAQVERIIGHRTDARLRQAFGDRLDAMSGEERERVVHTVRSFRSQAALARALETTWGLPAEDAAWLAEPKNGFEEARGSVSVKAIRRLLPLMRQGMTYGEARKAAGFASDARHAEPLDRLPPVLPASRAERSATSPLRNPSVVRALTEVRKLVNAVIARYGKPETIRVELARDLKRTRGEREAVTRRNRTREKERAALLARIVAEGGIARPSRDDVDKALLWEECGGICPYTGRSIDFKMMFGRNPQVDVEHIWPKSRCLDDGFANKTLCFAEENRSRKRGRTPFEAYGADTDRYNQMLDRVARFKGDPGLRKEKLRRFAVTEIDAGFSDRHLSDTRFIARACSDYLALLYGGNTTTRIDQEGTRRVQTPTGGLTAWLRSGWGLSRLLGDSAEKNRSDHRHHAIDAMVVAMSDPAAVKRLADAAGRAEKVGKLKAFESVEEPFHGFRDQAKGLIDGMIVAHRQSRKVTGALHNETVYSRRIATGGAPGGSETARREHRVRKELFKLTPAEIEEGKIVDGQALEAIRAKLAELGIAKPDAKTIGQVFGDPANAPLVPGYMGTLVKLRKVRVRATKRPEAIGGRGRRSAGARFSLTEGNHHTLIVETRDGRGRTVWADEPVTLVEAFERMSASRPVVDRELGGGRKFVCSLSPSDCLEIDVGEGASASREVYRVESLSEGDNVLRLHRDARPRDEAKGTTAYVRASGEKLRKLNARKVRVTYLGEILPAND